MKLLPAEKRILRDYRSGSSEILSHVLSYNLQFISNPNLDSRSIKRLIEFNKTVINKFTSMAIIENGLKKANGILVNLPDQKRPYTRLPSNFEKLIKEFNGIDKKIANNCRRLFSNKRHKITIATYSNSGLVKKILKAYKSRIAEVYLSEARPANEGRDMAKYLAGLGIKVYFTVDILLPRYLQRAELLLLGADCVGENIFVNKIGSETLLNEARKYGVRSAVLFESLKIKKIGEDSESESGYNVSEVWPRFVQEKINIINEYFEIIDNKGADLFISDLGVDDYKSLKKKISKIYS